MGFGPKEEAMMIDEKMLDDLGFTIRPSVYGGRAWIKDLPSPAQTSIMVTFSCYYCKRDQVDFCVWIRYGDVVFSNDIGIEHIKTKDQIELLWLALTGQPLIGKHYLIMSKFGPYSVGCTTDRTGVLKEDLDSTFVEYPQQTCPHCSLVKSL